MLTAAVISHTMNLIDDKCLTAAAAPTDIYCPFKNNGLVIYHPALKEGRDKVNKLFSPLCTLSERPID